MATRIAVVGWGSLLWEPSHDFNSILSLRDWDPLGPNLMLEFSRISARRAGALTLVVDRVNGAECGTFFNVASLQTIGEVRHALAKREGCRLNDIGYIDNLGGNEQSRDVEVATLIREWSLQRRMDAVVWTDLPSNFEQKCGGVPIGTAFSVESALSHLKSLPEIGRQNAHEYLSRSPERIETPLKSAYFAASNL